MSDEDWLEWCRQHDLIRPLTPEQARFAEELRKAFERLFGNPQ